MIKFFYDSLETLQKVKFATKRDYISLGLGVIFAIVVCGVFFVGVDAFFTGAYKTLYTVMKSDTDTDPTADQSTELDLSGDTENLSGNLTISGVVAITGDTTTATGLSL